MHLFKSLQKRINALCFTRLIADVKQRKLRSFSVDEKGLWFETKYGFSVYSNLRDRILELDTNPAWEEMESSFVVNNVNEGDVFLDVGANIGYFSLLAARQKAATVLAIEPVPKTYEILKMNIKHNKLDNLVKAFNIALGSEDGIAKFTCSLGPKNHAEYQTDNIHSNLPTVSVTITTLDHFLESKKEIKSVDFIKVDIEGLEYDFLLGAQKAIRLFKPIILIEIEEHRLAKYNARAEKIFSFMDSLSYQYLSVRNDSIVKGTVYDQDLSRGRNFVFYTFGHDLIY